MPGSRTSALTDAHRAVYFAPESAAVPQHARNGSPGARASAAGARAPIEQALAARTIGRLRAEQPVLRLDARGRGGAEPSPPVSSAIALDPQLAAAQEQSRPRVCRGGRRRRQPASVLRGTGDSAAALVQHRHRSSGASVSIGSAVTAFQEAHSLRPTMTQALARAKQAATAAADAEE